MRKCGGEKKTETDVRGRRGDLKNNMEGLATYKKEKWVIR